ncbi:cyclin-domain-containing protein [Metschnikowia bicuspidata var. bicuspidata NRRL YB-4993]|uniref:Cyclin-domain-containing protein n=1 Tax=Metschnikowia bicuspidata var. bicuspidata NRRL YB-4993 TaxID=869754 RepID=A0A1A0H4M6_9ASCO|nr:cyclin-domain-containing protein [Metschnikowia bicuspidata var. bicuspidata NRRL YB-4993]OBA19029.1 cyclin-domain-containing protein [Metschnikowia bicuspidata var. bicuspidata NRRL YB-4993]
MSPATRQNSPVQSGHGSPRLKPPANQKHDLDATMTSQQRQERSENSPVIEYEGPPVKSQDFIDPFLSQYIKPTSDLNHEIYFRSLNKQVCIKSFDYYQKYLNHDKGTPNRITSLKHDTTLAQKPKSPLRQEVSPKLESRIEQKPDTLDQRIPQRRRQPGIESGIQPDLKKTQHELISETLLVHFEECPTTDLINLMARMILSLISLNDRSVPASISSPPAFKSPVVGSEQKNKLLTRYHSRTPPAISIHTYISRLAKFNNLTPATLLTTIYYIDLLSHNFQPYFTLNSWTVHRFLLVATMLAQKSLEDFFYTNDHYARVGGVALTELNFLELDFLNRVDWKVVPAKQILSTQTSIKHSKEVLDLYYWQLVNLMGKNITEMDRVTYFLSRGSDD